MISHLTGKTIHKNDTYMVLDVNGVGFKIFATGNTLEKIKNDELRDIWIHTAIRENSHDLYGFLTHEELSFFELLISIPGIGPKTALGILNVANIESIKQAVRSGNAAHLTTIAGIGKKNAEKIVLELGGKIEMGAEAGINIQEEGDAIEALSSLGYSQREVREALRQVPSEISGTSQRVKYALKILGK
ncbi:MAG TPA: Holliday junction branch migration protein RuvA [Candidatus Paceibacterota bacterium]